MIPPVFIYLRPCTVYSMGDGSFDEPKLFPTGKKLTFKLSFIFSFNIIKKFGDFFTESVSFLLKNHRNILNIARISRRQPASRFLYFFPPTKEKNPCRDPSPMEYTAHGLKSEMCPSCCCLIKYPQNFYHS